MKSAYLVRHGEYDNDDTSKSYGKLIQTGIEQTVQTITKIKSELQDDKWDIYHGPAPRLVESAEIMRQRLLPIVASVHQKAELDDPFRFKGDERHQAYQRAASDISSLIAAAHSPVIIISHAPNLMAYVDSLHDESKEHLMYTGTTEKSSTGNVLLFGYGNYARINFP